MSANPPLEGTLTQSTTLAERRWAAGVHIGALLLALLTSWGAGIAGALGAGAVALVRPMDSNFVANHAKEAFNFNLSLFIYALAGLVFGVLTLGLGFLVVLPLWLVLAVMWLVCSVIATMRAADGLTYRYPFTFRIWN